MSLDTSGRHRYILEGRYRYDTFKFRRYTVYAACVYISGNDYGFTFIVEIFLSW